MSLDIANFVQVDGIGADYIHDSLEWAMAAFLPGILLLALPLIYAIAEINLLIKSAAIPMAELSQELT